MPQKKKSAPKNAFFYFMEEFREREEAHGVFYNTIAEVAAAAGPEWQALNAEERRPYEARKVEAKAGKKEKKYTALGEDISVYNKRNEDIERKKKLMIQNIENLVSEGNDFVTKYFYVAHVNHYCFCNALSKHIPAEISIVRFNLRDGINLEDCYHVILDTGSMPLGYRLAAVTVSEETHLIPVPPHDGDVEHISEKNIRKALLEMVEFLRKDLNPRERLPPVYVDDTNMDMATDVFTNLHYDFDGDNPYNEISVYSLSYLFFVLRNAAHSKVSNDKAFPFPTIPQAELEKDIYDYVKGIACEYHNTCDDAYPHCSLSKCVRKIFVICDHTCYDLDIQLIPGRHVPKNARAQKLEQRPSSETSWVTVGNSRPSSSLSMDSRCRANTPLPVPAARPENTIVEEMENVVITTTNTSNNNRNSNHSAGYAAAAAGRSGSLRKPLTASMAYKVQPAHPPDLQNDFPALGSSKPSRPPVVGRGRGRILE